jgi:hypothetical protein
MSVRRLVVRVRTNLEWVLGVDDSAEEQPIGVWADYAREDVKPSPAEAAGPQALTRSPA